MASRTDSSPPLAGAQQLGGRQLASLTAQLPALSSRQLLAGASLQQSGWMEAQAGAARQPTVCSAARSGGRPSSSGGGGSSSGSSGRTQGGGSRVNFNFRRALGIGGMGLGGAGAAHLVGAEGGTCQPRARRAFQQRVVPLL